MSLSSAGMHTQRFLTYAAVAGGLAWLAKVVVLAATDGAESAAVGTLYFTGLCLSDRVDRHRAPTPGAPPAVAARHRCSARSVRVHRDLPRSGRGARPADQRSRARLGGGGGRRLHGRGARVDRRHLGAQVDLGSPNVKRLDRVQPPRALPDGASRVAREHRGSATAWRPLGANGGGRSLRRKPAAEEGDSGSLGTSHSLVAFENDAALVGTVGERPVNAIAQ